MSPESKREIYFSFFMFTADLRPEEPHYTRVLVDHLRALSKMGYDGFDLHIAVRPASVDHQQEVDDYVRLKHAFDEAGLVQMKFATNVGTTPYFDPTSPYVDGAGWPWTTSNRESTLPRCWAGTRTNRSCPGRSSIPTAPFRSRTRLNALERRPTGLDAAPLFGSRSVMEELAEYAAEKGVKPALEPVKNWETPPPNMVSEVLEFLESLGDAPCGVTIDTAQVLLESQGPDVFRKNVGRAAGQGRLAYVHISPPDRGAVRDSWIPWDLMLGEIEPVYNGPYLIEIFNAIPPFDALMRMSRRRFWRPGEDDEGPEHLNAYHIAYEALHELRQQIARVRSASGCGDGLHTRETSHGHETARLSEPVPGKGTFGMKVPPTGQVHSGSVRSGA